MTLISTPCEQSASLHFRLLGPVEIEVVAGRTVSPARRRERCILGLLLLELNRTVTVDRLTELLWDGDPPEQARRTVQSHVSRIRALIGATFDGSIGVELVSTGDGYRLVAEPITVDVHQFRALMARAAAAGDPAERIAHLRAGLTLWRGPALEDAATGWLRDRVCADLEELRMAALEDLMSNSLALGQGRQILPELTQLAQANPQRERLAALHMYALHQAGRTGDSLAVYRRTRSHLTTELGLEPGPILHEAHKTILEGRVTETFEPLEPAQQRPPTQRTPSTKPSQRIGPWCPPVPRQLPADVSGFVGRVEPLRWLEKLLPDTRTRAVVVAITGAAGVGKSALAVHWAHRIANSFPDGQVYLDLRGFAAETPLVPARALTALLTSLGVPSRRIPDEAIAAGLYRSLLAGRRVLVVLDNAASADQVRPLLPGAAGCPVIVTSRDRLTGLVARDGANRLSLDALTAAEAQCLLRGVLGAEWMAAEPEAAARLAASCAYLPLALRNAAVEVIDHAGSDDRAS